MHVISDDKESNRFEGEMHEMVFRWKPFSLFPHAVERNKWTALWFSQMNGTFLENAFSLWSMWEKYSARNQCKMVHWPHTYAHASTPSVHIKSRISQIATARCLLITGKINKQNMKLIINEKRNTFSIAFWKQAFQT